MRTPFVSTDVGSISEIANERYSRLVPSRDATALADAIVTVQSQMGSDAVDPCQSRSWADCAASLSQVLTQMGSAATGHQFGKPQQLATVAVAQSSANEREVIAT